jgi:hypothetical protein
MVPLPIAIPGACVEDNSPYVTSGRYQQDLAEAMQLPDRIRSKIIAAMSPSQAQSSQQPQVESIFRFQSDIQPAGTTSPATPSSSTTAQSRKIPPFPVAPDLKNPLPQAGTIPAAMSSYSTTEQSDEIAPVPENPNVVTRAFDGGTYSFVRQPQTSGNPIYKVGDVQLGGDDALLQDEDAKWHGWKPGLDLGDVRFAVEGNGVKGSCSYDLRAYGDAVPGTTVNVSGTCTTDDGRTFKSTGEAYRNYQGGDSDWNINAGIGSTEPSNPFASVQLRASIKNDGTVSGDVAQLSAGGLNGGGVLTKFASVSGKADAINPVGFNASTDRKEITLSNGDKCTIGVNPWSTDTNAVVGDCSTTSGSSYRLEGMAVNNVRSTNLTEYMVDGFLDGQRVYLSGDVAPGGNLSNLTTVGASVAQYRDIPDVQTAPVSAVVQQEAPSTAQTQAAVSVSQPVQATDGSANGAASCGGWWDDPFQCTQNTSTSQNDWGGGA